MKKLAPIFLLFAVMAVSFGVRADEESATALLKSRFPDLAIEQVRETALDGVMEVVYGGDQVAYVSRDGRYLLNGALIDLESQANLTEATQREMRELLGPRWLGLFQQIGQENFLTYDGDSTAPLAGRTITAFTDISCPWCGRLHKQIGELTRAGVSVNYILFARAGMASPTHRQHISIWCSDNPQDMLTHAKNGGSVAPTSCENPVDEHMALVQAVGVSGTPTLILDTGERVDGFRSAVDLISMLESREPVEPELP